MLSRFSFMFMATFVFSNLFGMDQYKKYVPEFTKSLKEVTPQFSDLIEIPNRSSWKPYYDSANEGYLQLIAQKNEHRNWVRKTLQELRTFYFAIEGSEEYVKLTYPTSIYALAVMALEDGKVKKAHNLFKKATEASMNVPQERMTYLHSLFGAAITFIHKKDYASASTIFTSLIPKLQHLFPNKKDANEQEKKKMWEEKLRTESTQIIEKIEMPWRIVPALILSTKKKEREMALGVLSELFKQMSVEETTKYGQDITASISLICSLADTCKIPEAQTILAYIHCEQRNKKTSIFGNKPVDPLCELEKAYRYILAASESGSQTAKSLRGEIAFHLGRRLENHVASGDTTERVHALYKDSAEHAYTGGIGRHAFYCLQNPKTSQDQAKEHFQDVRRAARDGLLSSQDLLAKCFFWGNKFECGYEVEQNLIEAFEYASIPYIEIEREVKQVSATTKPIILSPDMISTGLSIDMLIIRGLILSTGIKETDPKILKKAPKKEKLLWKVNSDYKSAIKAFQKAIAIDEETAYVKMHEYYVHEKTPNHMKQFILEFIQEKYKQKNASLFAIRAYGVLLMFMGNMIDGVKILESIGKDYKNPQGYFELCGAFTHGVSAPLDLCKATNYCIKALHFYSKETMTSEGKSLIESTLRPLLHLLISPPGNTDAKNKLALTLLQKEMNRIGVTWQIKSNEQ